MSTALIIVVVIFFALFATIVLAMILAAWEVGRDEKKYKRITAADEILKKNIPYPINRPDMLLRVNETLPKNTRIEAIRNLHRKILQRVNGHFQRVPRQIHSAFGYFEAWRQDFYNRYKAAQKMTEDVYSVLAKITVNGEVVASRTWSSNEHWDYCHQAIDRFVKAHSKPGDSVIRQILHTSHSRYRLTEEP